MTYYRLGRVPRSPRYMDMSGTLKPFWPSPPPSQVNLLLTGPLDTWVDGFLTVHGETTSIGDAYLKAYDFVKCVETLWTTTVFV